MVGIAVMAVAAMATTITVTEQFVFETRRNSREAILMRTGRLSWVNWRTWQYSLRDGISPVELIAVANARSKLKTDRT